MVKQQPQKSKRPVPVRHPQTGKFTTQDVIDEIRRRPVMEVICTGCLLISWTGKGER